MSLKHDKAWIQVYSGRPFWPLSPKVEDMHIEDIAHALSMQCRYAGHTKWHYSVAQHSVLVSESVSPEHALWGLLHDASEAYLTDIPRPVKHHPNFQFYRNAEAEVMRCICEKFGLPVVEPDEVKQMDRRICFNEREVLLHRAVMDWELTGEPIPGVKVTEWSPADAKFVFLDVFKMLLERRDGTKEI